MQLDLQLPDKVTPGGEDRPQHVLTTSTHVHLSSFLYLLYTYDCVATRNSNIMVKSADDMTVICLLSHSDENAYIEEVRTLALCARKATSRELNVEKIKELIVDYRRNLAGSHTSLTINEGAVERVNSFKGSNLAKAQSCCQKMCINLSSTLGTLRVSV